MNKFDCLQGFVQLWFDQNDLSYLDYFFTEGLLVSAMGAKCLL
jgi:hypothetical protein